MKVNILVQMNYEICKAYVIFTCACVELRVSQSEVFQNQIL